MATGRSETFAAPEARLSFAQSLFKARAQTEGGAKKFGCTLIFPNAARAQIEAHIRTAILDAWGERGIEMAKNGLIKSPILAGDGKEARNKTTGEIAPGLGKDVFFIRPTATEEYPPAVYATTYAAPAKPSEVYSGCYGKAALNAFTWDHPQNGKGVSFGIVAFRKTRDGDQLGGGGGLSDPEALLGKIEDTGDAPVETKSGAGAAGLFG